MKTCKLVGCFKSSYCKDLCKAHYNKLREYGDVRHNGRLSRRKPIRFRVSADGCFECTSHLLNSSGYPEYHFNGKKTTVYKYIYEECFGHVEDGKIVRHKCDNRLCINPEHLLVGTHIDNMRDMTSRNRQCKGVDSPFAKLNEKDVKKIRELFDEDLSNTKIADLFNVSRTTIYYIRKGKTWRHVS